MHIPIVRNASVASASETGINTTCKPYHHRSAENSDKNIYIESMSFNGVNYTKNYLDHNELLKGGVLDIKMGDKPNLNRGVNPEDFPYSFSVDEKKKK